MDYKARFPKISTWPASCHDKLRHPLPYEYPGYGGIHEFNSPDGSATFLAIPARVTEYPEGIVYYLLEAPPGCPMRVAYESGKISFDDFLDHKGWLIEMTSVIGSDLDEEVRYIHPCQIDTETRANLQEFSGNPFEILLSNMEWLNNFDREIGRDPTPRVRKANEILRLHRSKIAASSALNIDESRRFHD